jgi:hypothetical protein
MLKYDEIATQRRRRYFTDLWQKSTIAVYKIYTYASKRITRRTNIYYVDYRKMR